jgi:hypothetical protein
MRNINIKEFKERFDNEYDFLYNSKSYVAGYDEAVEAFDNFLQTNKGFIKEFILYRGDFISSDREAAAFMFTLENYL